MLARARFCRKLANDVLDYLSIPIRYQSASLARLERPELTDRAREYHENGYLVVPQLFNQRKLQSIKTEMIEICRGNRGEIEGAKLDNTSSDEEILEKYLCVHFPHKISQSVLDFASKHEGTVNILKEITSPNVKLIQTMMFMKGPGQAGQNWHQDECYIPTRDRSLCGCWVAIDDALIDNGCLWIIPKSHQNGFIYPTKDHEDHDNFDRTPRAIIEYYGEYNYVGYCTNYNQDIGDHAIPVQVKSGDAIFCNGYTLHRSLKNVSDRFRLSFANHYMSAESMLPWNYDNRIDGYIRDSRDIVMCCGVDPYQYKGIENLETTKHFVRENVGHNMNF